MDFEIGDVFELITLETCRDIGVSRPRVRPLSYFPKDIRVEFPRRLREDHPVGTRFRANVKVCQKHQRDGTVKGQLYLRADSHTILLVRDFTPGRIIMAMQKPDCISERIYDYVILEETEETAFEDLRRKALDASASSREGVLSETQVYKRSEAVKLYAMARSEGVCEACDTPAPFIRKKDGAPYLEVHHIKEISSGGADSIENVAAICPNCHSRVTYGDDGATYNQAISQKIKIKESNLGPNS